MKAKTARTEHTVTIQAPADVLRRLITRTERWPVLFEPVVYAAPNPNPGLNPGPEPELELWTRHDDRIVHWSGTHRLDPHGLRLDFRYTAVGHPATAVSGRWTLEPLDPGTTRVTLHHESRRARSVWERLFAEQLPVLRRHAELGAELDALVFTFEDTLRSHGSPEDVHAFLYRVQGWPGAVSHVAAVTLEEPAPGVQQVTTSVRAPDGSVTAIPSVRVRLRDRIVYTPLTVPPFATAHLGEWIVATGSDGLTSVTGRHTVALAPTRIAAAFGPGTTPADARSRVRAALGAHSLATLDAARAHAESRLTPAVPAASAPRG
ncbi:SRPBCC family protein [Streptacidiphilus sp. N1-10]|uniref:SRPBCC family protein n=1 Tax=Streptacidiphilus jeojiensis TaxID=3229225 RepID=A0ABV6XHB8_9ACTN